MTRFPNDYPADWAEIANRVKIEAERRCVRCHHPFAIDGSPQPCDAQCDPLRGIHTKFVVGRTLAGLNFGVHHLDGNKANSAWWNLLALDNSCHLTTQARVIVERPWILAHSEWFVPYVAGFYASYHGGLTVTRAEVEVDPARFLAMGQPQLYAAEVST